MQTEKNREIVRLFERAAIEHMAWLTRVHSALMFPGTPGCPSAAQLIAPAPCSPAQCEDFPSVLRLRAVMQEKARRLVEKVRRNGVVDPAEYRTFMNEVEAYWREFRRVEAHMRRVVAETDPLTGVQNRQGMMRDLRREWTRALRTGQPICVAMADLDYFKAVNDTWGHCVGDRVLCAAAHFFQQGLRPYDSVYRFGGEEFLFCLPNTDGPTAALVLDRLRCTLAGMPVAVSGGVRIPVTCSIGVAQLAPNRSIQDAVAAADRALYCAKHAGRNRVALAEELDDGPPPDRIPAQAMPMRGALQ